MMRMPILPSLVLLILAVNVARGSGSGIALSAKSTYLFSDMLW